MRSMARASAWTTRDPHVCHRLAGGEACAPMTRATSTTPMTLLLENGAMMVRGM